MKKILPTLVPVFMLLIVFLQTGNTYAQTADTLNRPTVKPFVPGEIPARATSSAAPAFSLDGKRVLLGQSASPGDITIMESQLAGADWSARKPAAFSGKYRDLEPVFSPDGKYLIFASNRPVNPKGNELDGRYNGQELPGKGGNLWRIKYEKGDWGKPEVLAAIINSNTSVFSPAIAGDGSLYFMRADSGKKFHIYRAQMRHGKFEPPVLASFTDYSYGDFDPAVSPDESFIVFSSGRPPAPHTSDLFIAFRTENGWGAPIDLRSALSEEVHGVEARLSPDHKTLYFSKSSSPSGQKVPNASYIWKVDISGLLKTHGIE
jgi:Tol biopolymer transport system component